MVLPLTKSSPNPLYIKWGPEGREWELINNIVLVAMGTTDYTIPIG